MKKEQMIRQINFSNFYQISNVGLFPDQAALFESTEGENIGFGKNHMQVIVLGICLTGSVKFRLGERNCTSQAGCAILIMPGYVLQVQERSRDYSALFIALTPKLITLSNQMTSCLKQQFVRMRTNVVLQLCETDWKAVVDSFLHVRDKYDICRNNDLHKKMFELQVFSIFYEFCGYLTPAKPNSEQLLSKKEVLFRDFIRQVAKHYSHERSIAFYANRLGVDAKYLSVTIEAASHKAPKQWIDEYVIQKAKRLLKSSDMSIGRIAEELCFVDQSFFGKYFRRIEGLTPREFRRSGT